MGDLSLLALVLSISSGSRSTTGRQTTPRKCRNCYFRVAMRPGRAGHDAGGHSAPPRWHSPNRNQLRRIPAGLLGGILGIAIVYAVDLIRWFSPNWALQWMQANPPPHDFLQILKDNPAAWLRAADVISACVVAPIAEEMFFRGLLQTVLRNLFNNPWAAIIFTAAAIAMVHPWWTWPQIFFLGFCLGYAVRTHRKPVDVRSPCTRCLI